MIIALIYLLQNIILQELVFVAQYYLLLHQANGFKWFCFSTHCKYDVGIVLYTYMKGVANINNFLCAYKSIVTTFSSP